MTALTGRRARRARRAATWGRRRRTALAAAVAAAGLVSAAAASASGLPGGRTIVVFVPDGAAQPLPPGGKVSDVPGGRLWEPEGARPPRETPELYPPLGRPRTTWPAGSEPPDMRQAWPSPSTVEAPGPELGDE